MAAEWVQSQPWKFKVQAIEVILAAVVKGDREAPIEPPVPLDASGPAVWQLINDALFDAHVKVNSMGCRLFEAVAVRMSPGTVLPAEAVATFSSAENILKLVRRRPTDELVCMFSGLACVWSVMMASSRAEVGLQLSRTLSLLARDLSLPALAPRRPDQASPRATIVVLSLLADAALALHMGLSRSCRVLPGAVLACASSSSLIPVASDRKDLPSAAMARAALQVCRDAAASSRAAKPAASASSKTHSKPAPAPAPAAAVIAAGHARNAAIEAACTALGVIPAKMRAADAYAASGMSEQGGQSLLACVWSCLVCLCRKEVSDTTSEWLNDHDSASESAPASASESESATASESASASESEPPPPALTALAAAFAHTKGALSEVAAAPGTNQLAACAMRSLMHMAKHSRFAIPVTATSTSATASAASEEDPAAKSVERSISMSLELAGIAAITAWERDDSIGWKTWLNAAAAYAKAGRANAKRLNLARGDSAAVLASKRQGTSSSLARGELATALARARGGRAQPAEMSASGRVSPRRHERGRGRGRGRRGGASGAALLRSASESIDRQGRHSAPSMARSSSTGASAGEDSPTVEEADGPHKRQLPESLGVLPEFRVVAEGSFFGHDSRRSSPSETATGAAGSPSLVARVRVAGDSVVGGRALAARSARASKTLSPAVFNSVTKRLNHITAMWISRSHGQTPFGTPVSDVEAEARSARAETSDSHAAAAAAAASRSSSAVPGPAEASADEGLPILPFIAMGETGAKFLGVLRSYVRNVAIKATRSAAVDCVISLLQAPVDVPAILLQHLIDDAVSAMSDTSAMFARQCFRLLHAASARCGVDFALARAVVALHPAGSTLQEHGAVPVPLSEDSAFTAVGAMPVVPPEPASTAIKHCRAIALTSSSGDSNSRFDATISMVEAAGTTSNGGFHSVPAASASLSGGRLLRGSTIAPQLQTRVLQWIRGALARAEDGQLPESLLLVIARVSASALEDRSAAVRDTAAACLGECLDLLREKETVRQLMDGVDLLKASRLASLSSGADRAASMRRGRVSSADMAVFESRAPRDGRGGSNSAQTAARLCDAGFNCPPRMPSLRRLCERRLQAMVITGVWDVEDAGGDDDATASGAGTASAAAGESSHPPSPSTVFRQADDLIRAATTSGVKLHSSKDKSRGQHQPQVDDVALGNAIELLAAAPGLQAYRLQVTCVLFLKSHSRALVASGLVAEASPAAKTLMAHYRIPPKQSSSFAQHRSGLRRAATSKLHVATFTAALSATWGVKMAQRKLIAFFIKHRRAVLADLYQQAPIDGADVPLSASHTPGRAASTPRTPIFASPPPRDATADEPVGVEPPPPPPPLSPPPSRSSTSSSATGVHEEGPSASASPSNARRHVAESMPFDCLRVPIAFIETVLRGPAAAAEAEEAHAKTSPRHRTAGGHSSIASPVSSASRSASRPASGKLGEAQSHSGLTPDEQLALLAWWARPLSSRRNRVALVDPAAISRMATALPLVSCSKECLAWARSVSPAMFSLLDAAVLFDVLCRV